MEKIGYVIKGKTMDGDVYYVNCNDIENPEITSAHIYPDKSFPNCSISYRQKRYSCELNEKVVPVKLTVVEIEETK